MVVNTSGQSSSRKRRRKKLGEAGYSANDDAAQSDYATIKFEKYYFAQRIGRDFFSEITVPLVPQISGITSPGE